MSHAMGIMVSWMILTTIALVILALVIEVVVRILTRGRIQLSVGSLILEYCFRIRRRTLDNPCDTLRGAARGSIPAWAKRILLILVVLVLSAGLIIRLMSGRWDLERVVFVGIGILLAPVILGLIIWVKGIYTEKPSR